MAFGDQLFKWLGSGKYSAAPSVLTDGAISPLLMDASGSLKVTLAAAAKQWASFAAPGYRGLIKPAGGALWQVRGFNDGASTRYVQLYDATLEPNTGAIPLEAIRVPAGSVFALVNERGRAFVTGIYWVASTAAATYQPDTAATVALTAEYE